MLQSRGAAYLHILNFLLNLQTMTVTFFLVWRRVSVILAQLRNDYVSMPA